MSFSTTSLGNLYQVMTTLVMKSLLLLSNWTLFHFVVVVALENDDTAPVRGASQWEQSLPQFLLWNQPWLVMDVSPGSDIFPWATPEDMASLFSSQGHISPSGCRDQTLRR